MKEREEKTWKIMRSVMITFIFITDIGFGKRYSSGAKEDPNKGKRYEKCIFKKK